MIKDAQLKVDRATEHVAYLSELLRERRAFSYILETDTYTGERATFAKRNDAVVDRVKAVGGEAIHALRTAIDYTYWHIVSPNLRATDREGKVQFPFCERADRLNEAVSDRLAQRVSQSFVDAVMNLKPYAESGGNTLLYLVHRLDITDKHRFPTPVGDYTKVSMEMLRRQVPDAPTNIMGTISFGQNRRDIVWDSQGPWGDLGTILAPTKNIFHKELDVPVEVVFVVSTPDYRGPVVPTLHQLVDVTRETIDILHRAAGRR